MQYFWLINVIHSKYCKALLSNTLPFPKHSNHLSEGIAFLVSKYVHILSLITQYAIYYFKCLFLSENSWEHYFCPQDTHLLICALYVATFQYFLVVNIHIFPWFCNINNGNEHSFMHNRDFSIVKTDKEVCTPLSVVNITMLSYYEEKSTPLAGPTPLLVSTIEPALLAEMWVSQAWSCQHGRAISISPLSHCIMGGRAITPH